VVERAMLLGQGDAIGLGDLPEEIAGAPRSAGQAVEISTARFSEQLLAEPLAAARAQVVEQFERAYLAALLEQNRGRIGVTADRAGITPRSLYDKMKRYGLRKEDFKR
jgi:DNA-binding NtrC family response regulator